MPGQLCGEKKRARTPLQVPVRLCVTACTPVATLARCAGFSSYFTNGCGDVRRQFELLTLIFANFWIGKARVGARANVQF